MNSIIWTTFRMIRNLYKIIGNKRNGFNNLNNSWNAKDSFQNYWSLSSSLTRKKLKEIGSSPWTVSFCFILTNIECEICTVLMFCAIFSDQSTIRKKCVYLHEHLVMYLSKYKILKSGTTIEDEICTELMFHVIFSDQSTNKKTHQSTDLCMYRLLQKAPENFSNWFLLSFPLPICSLLHSSWKDVDND